MLINPQENKEENIFKIIANLYQEIEKNDIKPEVNILRATKISFYQNELQRRYIQKSLEVTEKALEASEKYNKSAQKTVWISIVISVFALIISIFIGWFSINSSNQWQKEQLPVLKSIDSNIGLTLQTFENFKNKPVSVLKNTKNLQKKGLKK